MQQVQGVFELTGIINGDTFNGFLRVQGKPLLQVFFPGTDKVDPDFTKISTDQQPTVVPVIRAASTGGVIVPQTYTWKYNGVGLTFDGTTNLCTNAGMEGVFEKIASLAVTIDGDSYNLPALRVKKNLAAIGNYDNDRISFSGTIESGGNQITINEISTAVQIIESTGNSYALVIETSDMSLDSTSETITMTAKLYKEGVELSETTGYTFTWYKVGVTDTQFGTGKTKTVTRDDVNWMQQFRCDVSQGDNVLCTAFVTIMDNVDAYYASPEITGISGRVIAPGQTANVTMKIINRETDSVVSSTYLSWTWRVRDNKGHDFTLTGKSGATFTGDTFQVSHTDMQNAGYGMSFAYSCNVDV